MNENLHEKDGPLSKTLQSWKVTATLPPRFQEQVWQRIARAEETTQTATLWVLFRQWLEAALSRRAVAVSYMVILLAVGLTTGYRSGLHKNRELEAGLSERYLQSVDPYQTHAGEK